MARLIPPNVRGVQIPDDVPWAASMPSIDCWMTGCASWKSKQRRIQALDILHNRVVRPNVVRMADVGVMLYSSDEGKSPMPSKRPYANLHVARI
jgi:hypothetical protein